MLLFKTIVESFGCPFSVNIEMFVNPGSNIDNADFIFFFKGKKQAFQLLKQKFGFLVDIIFGLFVLYRLIRLFNGKLPYLPLIIGKNNQMLMKMGADFPVNYLPCIFIRKSFIRFAYKNYKILFFATASRTYTLLPTSMVSFFTA